LEYLSIIVDHLHGEIERPELAVYQAHRVERRHFNSTSRKVGYGDKAEALLHEIIERTPEVLAEVGAELPVGLSERVADKVFEGVLAAICAPESMPAS
jgi:serine/threonine-protein kinase HipA